jgi:hypothetical protein
MNSDTGVAGLIAHYAAAKDRVVERGFASELAWVDSLTDQSFTESDLLREAAWVILCSGFRESVVRLKFSYLSLCFCDWESASLIAKYGDTCIILAEKAFGYRRKLEAISNIARELHDIGFDRVKDEIQRDAVGRLSSFPFIGPITSYHLAKNLGFQFAKDDRHLQRLVIAFGFRDAQRLCSAIAETTGDSIAMVDTILWRNAALSVKPSTFA